jgi:hypothetical protein
LRTQNFGGHVYHGRLDWRQGRWHHATRNGRNGWWCDVGGVWYFYPEEIEGRPDYVSDIEVSANVTTEVADDATTASLPPTPPKPHFVFYYRHGDFLGTRYQTFEECYGPTKLAHNTQKCAHLHYEPLSFGGGFAAINQKIRKCGQPHAQLMERSGS